MSAQHHEAHVVQPTGLPDPETLQRLDELQAEINRRDSVIRSLPDSTDPDSDIRRLQAERNEIQAEYDKLAAEVKRGGSIRTLGDFESQEAKLTEQRDQLVLAQNAPFTDSAPQASGGESKVPEGVVDSPAGRTGIPRANAAGVVHYPVPEVVEQK